MVILWCSCSCSDRTENGHNRNTLTNIATEYLWNINKPKSNDQKNNTNTIKLPRVPILGPKLRKEFKKKKIKTVFTSGTNLKSILCQNKSKLIPHSYPGVYTLNCSCNAEYIGETKKKVISRTIEHQQDSIKGKWNWTLFRMPWSIQLATPKNIIKGSQI